jgi:hypothetical protein
MAHQLVEHRVTGKRLGRNINHDPRSRAYAVEEAPEKITSVEYDIHGGPLDQGSLGSCVPNAELANMFTDPFYEPFHAAFPDVTLDEPTAVKLYSQTTAIDPYPGTYPPTDTGSDGLSVNKAAQANGWISGYTHALSYTAFLTGLTKTPGIIGIDWMSSFDDVGSDGVLKWTSDAYVRGGHEVLAFGYDATRGLVKCRNSWGPDWADHGNFYIPDDVMEKLLAHDGDATFGVPLSAPAPTPAPVPDNGFTMTFSAAELAVLRRWYVKPRSWTKSIPAAKIVSGKDV